MAEETWPAGKVIGHSVEWTEPMEYMEMQRLVRVLSHSLAWFIAEPVDDKYRLGIRSTDVAAVLRAEEAMG